jgi:hypothetical protein
MFPVLFIFASLLNVFAQPFDERIDLSYFGAAIFGKPIESDKKLIVDEHTNAEELGPYLEGDLLVPTSRSGMKAESLRWKNGEVPFEIRGSFSKSAIFLAVFTLSNSITLLLRCTQHGLD